MRRLLLIGIGVGDPDHLTVQAVKAMADVDVFFVIDKGPEKADLAGLRTDICSRHRPDGRYRTVEISDPGRDRDPEDYRSEVRAWHDQRAALYEQAIEGALGAGECGAFLVWGDPALYDSTLRIIDRVIEGNRLSVEVEVIPGISSVHVLAARHRVPLNRIGEGVHITTGRKLAAGHIPDDGDVVVMLDGTCAFTTVDFDADIYWGAYLGTPGELLISGRLGEVAEEIQRVRAGARAAHGWIMDIYLLRRRTA
ncbi:MAG: precorrin-6A synthase (deacetylating) [Acidimicrobiales bacterium]